MWVGPWKDRDLDPVYALSQHLCENTQNKRDNGFFVTLLQLQPFTVFFCIFLIIYLLELNKIFPIQKPSLNS